MGDGKVSEPLYAHCRACNEHNVSDRIAVELYPDKVRVICENHLPPLEVVTVDTAEALPLKGCEQHGQH